DTHTQPEIHNIEHRFAHCGTIEVEIGLMTIKAMPIVSLGYRIPSPIRQFEILKNNTRLTVFVGIITPNIKLALAAARNRPSRSLKPWMLVGSMIEDEFRNHIETTVVSFF